MADWRDQILKEFTPQVARLTLVADPDGLLLEEGVLQAIRARGFELIPFEDPITFRYAYESKFRSRWDRGEQTDLVVVLRSASGDLDALPYDLLEAGRKLCFHLWDLFPNLSYPVVAALDRGDIDALYDAQAKHNPGKLGDNATKDFALRHVFEIAPELIKQPSDLLRVLLRRHYRGQRIPPVLDAHFIQILKQNGVCEGWPLEQIIPDREAFFAFLQERWPPFLDRVAAEDAETEHVEELSYTLEFSGPLDLPFDHDDVRVFVDNLFLEGLLQSMPHRRSDILTEEWVAMGIRTDPHTDRLRRMRGLVKSVKDTLPASDARHQDWLLFAFRWAELTALYLEADTRLPPEVEEQIQDLRKNIDREFLAWVQKRYAGLHNQPPLKPVLLHHVPRALAREMSASGQTKVALVLVDGLSLDQWIILRNILPAQLPNTIFRENAVFAWIPTITSVCRQAAFAGNPPLCFPSSIHTTGKEAALWTQFWVNQGLTQRQVAYVKGLGDGVLDSVEEVLSQPKLRAVGLVVDKVDKIMHGMELGATGMHNQVRQWAMQGFMAKLLRPLLEHGFLIYLTSDHGNIEAAGCGSPSEGAVADLRGQRVRVYSDELLRSHVKGRFPDAIEWPSVGLPDDFLPLLAPHRLAFVREGERIVGHGGVSIEELVVPLIQVERRTT